jgi:hypothetical protein
MDAQTTSRKIGVVLFDSTDISTTDVVSRESHRQQLQAIAQG